MPVVEVEDSLTGYTPELGLPTSNWNIATVKELARLSTATMRQVYFGESGTAPANSTLANGLDLWVQKTPTIGSYVRPSEE